MSLLGLIVKAAVVVGVEAARAGIGLLVDAASGGAAKKKTAPDEGDPMPLSHWEVEWQRKQEALAARAFPKPDVDAAKPPKKE